MRKRPRPEQQKQIDEILAAQGRSIKRIVLSGGGAKGIVYPGAYRALLNSGLLAEVTDIAGSSAGAITAALMAVGAPIAEIRKTATTKNIGSFLGSQVKKANVGVIRRFTKDGKPLYRFMQEQITHALGTIDIDDLKSKLAASDKKMKFRGVELLTTLEGTKEITFAQLNLLNQLYPERFKNLTVTAVEYPAARLQQFDHKQTPNVSIALACRASASIPIALEPVEIEINGKKAFYIDGGLENNLPTNLISDPEHYEQTLVFAFGEGSKADIYMGTDRVEHAMHRSHWSEMIEESFLNKFYQDVFTAIKPRSHTYEAVHDTVLQILKKSERLTPSDPLHISPHTAKKLEKFLLSAVRDVYKTSQASPSAEQLGAACWAMIKKIKRPIYHAHNAEYLGQNILPKRLLGLNMPQLPTDQKYEDFRRIRDQFPLRTVNLHVGPVSSIDFKKATKLARVMDAIGYADTVGYILNHDLAKNLHLADYYQEVNRNFVIIYRALLGGMAKQPEKDSFLKRLNSLPKENNQFEAIKSHAIKHTDSTIAFAFTRAIEYQDRLIDRNTLLQETYVEAFRRKVFARSCSLGPTFFRTSSLENALQENPNLIPSIDTLVSKPRDGTRLNSIAHELQFLKEQQALDSAVDLDLNFKTDVHP